MNIFDSINENEKKSLLNCLRAVKKTYLKDEIIFDYANEIKTVGYVVTGKIHLLKDDYDGKKLIIAEIKQGETFGESIVCTDMVANSTVAVAKEKSEILFLDIKRILSVCQNSCPFHKKLVENILKIVAQKNMYLQKRIELLGKRTLSEKILEFLHDIKAEQKTAIFEIPYTREQMADYLGADRSALSRELSKLKQAGMIDYHKNSFNLLK